MEELLTTVYPGDLPRCRTCGERVLHLVVTTRGENGQVLGLNWNCQKCGRHSKDLSQWNIRNLGGLELEWI